MIKKYMQFIVPLALILFLLVPFAAAENRTITDIAGNAVSVPSDIQRVVTVDPFTSQFIYVIGADDKLVGTCVGPHDGAVLNKSEPTIAALPNAGCKQNVNIEQLMALKPDVVISSTGYSQANEKVQRAGIPLVQIDVEDMENLTKSYSIIGDLLGKKTEAKKFTDYYDEKMATIKKDVSGANASEKTTVYFAQLDPQQTLGSDYYESKIAALNGAENVASSLTGGDSKVSMDQLYTWNPAYIILLPYCPKSVDDILADPAWQSLDAVKNKKVYRMPKYIMTWETPTPESILGTMWMENTFHPDKVSYNFKDEIQKFYKEFYRLDLSSDDVDKILTDQSQIVVNKPKK